MYVYPTPLITASKLYLIQNTESEITLRVGGRKNAENILLLKTVCNF